MKIYIPRESIGRLIGWTILFTLTVASAYILMAWTVWEPNPANWNQAARIGVVVISMSLTLIRWAMNNFVVGQPNEE